MHAYMGDFEIQSHFIFNIIIVFSSLKHYFTHDFKLKMLLKETTLESIGEFI